jgi:Reverse transcriptase (RNA-dependent DNA polymerase).
MPFGLKGAPAIFQRLMTTVLIGIKGIKCSVYLNDVVVFRENLKVPNERLQEVLDRMRKYNMKLQPDKCEFLRKEASYLGHVIGHIGMRPDEKRVEAVKN